MGFREAEFHITRSPTDQGDVQLGTIRLAHADRKLVTVRLLASDQVTRRPVDGVELLVNDRVVAYTAQDGVARQTHVPAFIGLNVVTLRRIGYEPITFDVRLGPEQTEVPLRRTLAPAPVPLPGVVVEGRRTVELYPWMLGFEHRRTIGIGQFMDGKRILEVNGFDALSVLKWTDVTVTPEGSPWGHNLLIRSRESCAPVIFLDGLQVRAEYAMLRLDLLFPQDLIGIEVYSRPSDVPPAFAVPGACGLVAIWTRNRGVPR